MKRTLPLVVAFALFALLAPSPASAAANETISYNRDDTASLLGAAAYFDTIDPNDAFVNTTGGEFAAAGANVVFFVLNLIGDTSPSAFDANALPESGPYLQSVPLSDEASTNLDWLVTKYSAGAAVTRVDMLRFGAAVLVFLSGATAGANGVGMPPIDPGPPPTSSTSSTTTSTLDPGDPCNTLPLPQASCGLDAWLATWGSTISLLHKNVQTMADAGAASTCTDMRERARNMAVDAGPHAIAAFATAMQTAIEAFASEVSEGVYDCTGGGDRSGMTTAAVDFGGEAYGTDFGWWLTNQTLIQRLENSIDAALQFQYGCDAVASIMTALLAAAAPTDADLTDLTATTAALGAEDDCGFDDGAVTPNSIATKGEAARIDFDALMAAVRNGSSSYPLDSATQFAINDELIAVRSLSNEIEPGSTPACEAIGFATTYIAVASAQLPGSTTITNAKTAIDAMDTDCGTGAAAATYTAQQPVVASNLDTAIGWTV